MSIEKKDIEEAVHYAIERIPAQGPLEYFVHHNTIHHYQHLDFNEAVIKAAHDYQCNAYMPEEFYWKAYAERGIYKSHLFTEIDDFINKYQLQLPNHIVYRLLIQKETANRYLKATECEEVRRYFVRHKKYFFHMAIREDEGIDIDHFIAPHLYKFMAAYFDFGAATWRLNGREQGMWHCFCTLYQRASVMNSKFLKSLSQLIQKYHALDGTSALIQMIQHLNLPKDNFPDYFFELAIRFKGWVGFVKSLEAHPFWIKVDDIKPNHMELMAILVLSEHAAILSTTRQMPVVPRIEQTYLHSEQFIHHFFYELFKHHDLKEHFLQALPFLNDKSRKALLHQAYEKTFYHQFISTYATLPKKENHHPIDYQIICCLDEREESFRRYLEKDVACETFGHAGHFGLNMQFKGHLDERPRALCPIQACPEYSVTEVSDLRQTKTRKPSFRSLSILSPKFMQSNHTHVKTRLIYKAEENPAGMSLDARIEVASQLLTTIGLTKNFAPFVMLMGHGSSSLNNPHLAAYDCGACGGGRGRPNARLMATILNESEVREGLKFKNISIPKETYFIAAYHDTCNDEIHYDELAEEMPKRFHLIQHNLKIAASLNAKERCRRFSALPRGKPPNYYHQKVAERAKDFRQPRPEYGHSTNALCIIGPRKASKSLFLDRRCFLISYAPQQDGDGTILERILNTAGVVCCGINLEYYFSYIDNERYGCGSKLPHNVTSLVGVMNGYLSDLQNGLSSQMIEIHEPYRLCVLIICELSKMKNILKKPSEFSELVHNHWIKLYVHDIQDDFIYVFEKGAFILFTPSLFPPSYFQEDEDIFNETRHLSFGHISS